MQLKLREAGFAAAGLVFLVIMMAACIGGKIQYCKIKKIEKTVEKQLTYAEKLEQERLQKQEQVTVECHSPCCVTFEKNNSKVVVTTLKKK